MFYYLDPLTAAQYIIGQYPEWRDGIFIRTHDAASVLRWLSTRSLADIAAESVSREAADACSASVWAPSGDSDLTDRVRALFFIGKITTQSYTTYRGTQISHDMRHVAGELSISNDMVDALPQSRAFRGHGRRSEEYPLPYPYTDDGATRHSATVQIPQRLVPLTVEGIINRGDIVWLRIISSPAGVLRDVDVISPPSYFRAQRRACIVILGIWLVTVPALVAAGRLICPPSAPLKTGLLLNLAIHVFSLAVIIWVNGAFKDYYLYKQPAATLG
ncbi:hypothetical protein CDD80_5323 [Ophiocordyceps camponoti-rufipedis]|uniref:Uncharacterized protein n=1 Tax=Ophiocordyceps camponoti-rufipedis TaxID=2004952 RepID=A0A2C5XU80_9HYPO|nr:hypothetical protein CDD80_5323 [Ophiocordyceps camponoti-rufipedis]